MRTRKSVLAVSGAWRFANVLPFKQLYRGGGKWRSHAFPRLGADVRIPMRGDACGIG